MGYTEYGTVEKPIIDWLIQLGWTYVDPFKINRDPVDPFIQDYLKTAIRKLNPQLIKTNNDVEKIVEKLGQFPDDIRGNKEFFTWLKNEGSISLRTGEKNETINLIDYQNIENNTFTVTNQYKFLGSNIRRPDIMLLVNGLPLVLIECKTPTQQSLDYTKAISQIIRYNREIPQLFKYLAFCCATDGEQFRYGWTDEGRYARWRSLEEDPLKASVVGLLNKETLLDFILNFIIFETAHEEVTKKIAMQQQVEGTNRIVERVLGDYDNRGLIWHTQGSGKTLTMLFTAWKLKRQPQLENPTIIVVIDRIELQRQMRETFGNVGFSYVKLAETVEELLEKIRTQSREVIITTIQKFRRPRYIDPRKNIVILIDEAHRSQYGNLAISMGKTFPNAKIFGFTGTPIEKDPKGISTFRTFSIPSERYLHRYSIKQSIEDGSTIPIVYEPRLTREHIPKEILDKEFFKIGEGLSSEEREEIIQKSATLKTILKSGHRIEKVAKDVAEHFVSHVEPNGFKAQLVACDREACALYKEEFDKHHLLPPEYSTVIFSAGQNDPDLLRKYHMPPEKQLEIARNDFQKPGTLPNLLIVTDMLLTGFDAPIERVMYLDKPLRDHKLLQAIARTNRPYPGKDSALIIDYIGIFYRLRDALNFEAEDIEGVAVVLDTLKAEFEQTIKELLELLALVPRENTHESQIAVIKLLSDEEVHKTFKAKLSRAQALFETIAPDPGLYKFLEDYKWFNQVNEIYNKHLRSGKDSLKPYMEKTAKLIKEDVILKEIDKTLPTFEIDANYLNKIDAAHYDIQYEVAELRAATQHHIRINIDLNPLLESLGERLEKIVKGKDPEQMRQGLRDIISEINRQEDELKRKKITREEHALLVVVERDVPSLQESELIPFVKSLVGKLDSVREQLLFDGWQTKSETRRNVERLVFEECFNGFKDRVEPSKLLDLKDGLMEYVVRFRSLPS